MINRLRRGQQPWSVTTAAEVAAIAALEDDEYLARTIELIETESRLASKMPTNNVRMLDAALVPSAPIGPNTRQAVLTALQEVEELSDTVRGTGAYGSTGK